MDTIKPNGRINIRAFSQNVFLAGFLTHLHNILLLAFISHMFFHRKKKVHGKNLKQPSVCYC